MPNLTKRIQELRTLYNKHKSTGLKEIPTRTILVDPLLSSLGWDVRDPDEVELEYPTIDGKSVDYALKINRKPVILLEAKPLQDDLKDIKAISQIVSYAAIAGIEWCVLTNGILYKVYSASEKAAAPEKLLFEVSLSSDDPTALSTEKIESQLSRLSLNSMSQGVLDQLGEEIFLTAKVRKVMDRLIIEQDDALVKLVRKNLKDNSIPPSKIRTALVRVWGGDKDTAASSAKIKPTKLKSPKSLKPPTGDYGEAYHLKGVPAELQELYHPLDRNCMNLDPGNVSRRYKAKFVGWYIGNSMFCSTHVYKSRLAVWVKVDPVPPSKIARDVSKIGIWGSGNVELSIDSISHLVEAEPIIRQSYEAIAAKLA